MNYNNYGFYGHMDNYYNGNYQYGGYNQPNGFGPVATMPHPQPYYGMSPNTQNNMMNANMHCAPPYLPQPPPPPPPPQQFPVLQEPSKPSKVHVNPHFKRTVYINPQFNSKKNDLPNGTQIHINPNATRKKPEIAKKPPKILINPKMNAEKINQNILKEISASTSNTQTKNTTIHVNPNVLSAGKFKEPVTEGKKIISTRTKLVRVPTDSKKNVSSRSPPNSKFVLTRNKLIRVPQSSTPKIERHRRNSIISKYKLVKSSVHPKTPEGIRNKYKNVNKFRVDHRTPVRRKFDSSSSRKRFVYVNKLVSISDIAKQTIFKSSTKIIKRNMDSDVNKSKYKLVKKIIKSPINVATDSKKGLVKPFKVIRISQKKKVNAASTLKKCNVPCPIYRKTGRCLRKEKGTCYLKHNPDQISLCTKFLQGACINDSCRLSHKVSNEKMPTCKYYLEGSCSKETCPYLHVKISPKADICRDFLEGFCQKAAECDKRHQYLCPEYEKTGACSKKRCAYPHGKMVRKYTLNKTIVKKCSRKKESVKKSKPVTKNCDEPVEKSTRYYLDNEKPNSGDLSKNFNCEILPSRPKLGELPSYIPLLEDENK